MTVKMQKMKSLVLFFFLPFSLLFARFPSFAGAWGGLKAGIYYNLILTEPLVLDTGCYIFVGLEMHALSALQKLGPCWIDCRKARQISFSNCEFKGDHSGIGLLPGKRTVVKNCHFENLAVAIEVNSQISDSLLLENNWFENNGISICSDAENLLLELRGNVFKTDETKDRIGLKFGPKASIGNTIGSDGNFANPPPSGNIWPLASLQKQDTLSFLFLPLHQWVNRQTPPKGWQSIVNSNPRFELSYFRYDNEYVPGIEPNGSVLVHSGMFPELKYAYSKNDSNAIGAYFLTGNWSEVGTSKGACFPYKTWFSTNPQHQIKHRYERLDSSGKQIQLGDLVMNVQKSLGLIPIFIPSRLEGEVKIRIRKSGSPKEIKLLVITGRGKQIIEISTHEFQKGLYLYEVLHNNRPSSTRQWIFQ